VRGGGSNGTAQSLSPRSSLSLDLSKLNGGNGGAADAAAEEAKRAARKHVLLVLSQPLREGDGPAEAAALDAVRHFFVEYGNGPDAIVLFHKLVYSSRNGGYNSVDQGQAYGHNYNGAFVQVLEQTFTARSGRNSTMRDGLSTAASTFRTDADA
jgi:hypothetical protein